MSIFTKLFKQDNYNLGGVGLKQGKRFDYMQNKIISQTMPYLPLMEQTTGPNIRSVVEGMKNQNELNAKNINDLVKSTDDVLNTLSNKQLEYDSLLAARDAYKRANKFIPGYIDISLNAIKKSMGETIDAADNQLNTLTLAYKNKLAELSESNTTRNECIYTNMMLLKKRPKTKQECEEAGASRNVGDGDDATSGPNADYWVHGCFRNEYNELFWNEAKGGTHGTPEYTYINNQPPPNCQTTETEIKTITNEIDVLAVYITKLNKNIITYKKNLNLNMNLTNHLNKKIAMLNNRVSDQQTLGGQLKDYQNELHSGYLHYLVWFLSAITLGALVLNRLSNN